MRSIEKKRLESRYQNKYITILCSPYLIFMHKLFRFLIQSLKSTYFYKSCFFHFQLGVPKGKVIHTLTKSKALTEAAANSGGWAHIVVGQHHTLALDAAGNVHALGRMEYGRLGMSCSKLVKPLQA